MPTTIFAFENRAEVRAFDFWNSEDIPQEAIDPEIARFVAERFGEEDVDSQDELSELFSVNPTMRIVEADEALDYIDRFCF
jgi:hypothetical protein